MNHHRSIQTDQGLAECVCVYVCVMDAVCAKPHALNLLNCCAKLRIKQELSTITADLDKA